MKSIDFAIKKRAGEKISMITCYDYTTARILAHTTIDCLLVGDTLAMTMHGFKDTLAANLELMCYHTAAVSRGGADKFILGDLPFLSYRKSFSKNVAAAETIMKSGAHAIKLEGAAGNLKLIKHLVESGVPVMGHLGLTPQSVFALGGYKVQGKTEDSAERLKEDAHALEAAGCFALVIECVPQLLAKEVSEKLMIPTIGIGAGPYTDGQVLVLQDMLGLNMDFTPKFVKQFMSGQQMIQQSVEQYINEIKTGVFPAHEHIY